MRETHFCWLCISRATVEPPKKELGLFLEEQAFSVLRSTKTDPTVSEFSCFQCCFFLKIGFSSGLSSLRQPGELNLFIYMHINGSAETCGKSK